MKNLLFTAFCLLAIAACQDAGSAGNDAASATADTTATAPAAASDFVPQACFMRAEGRDTTWVGIAMGNNNSIRGTYDWTPWEKDGARGTFSGTHAKGMIYVVYDYVIEGSSQKEEKIFKIVGSQLEEAEGELQDSPDGILRLKDTTNLRFIPLARVMCKK